MKWKWKYNPNPYQPPCDHASGCGGTGDWVWTSASGSVQRLCTDHVVPLILQIPGYTNPYRTTWSTRPSIATCTASIVPSLADIGVFVHPTAPLGYCNKRAIYVQDTTRDGLFRASVPLIDKQLWVTGTVCKEHEFLLMRPSALVVQREPRTDAVDAVRELLAAMEV